MRLALISEFVVLMSGAITLAYPSYALSQGYSVGREWLKRERGFPAQLAFASTLWPLIHMLIRGQGWQTLWVYPAMLMASLVAAFLMITLLRHWAQIFSLVGMTAGAAVMFLWGGGRG
jgi:hypothetical protein